MFSSLELTNFTAFAQTRLDFAPTINLYIGENGSGKTHILKILYALQKHQFLLQNPERVEALDRTLMSVFKPDALGRLVNRSPGNSHCKITVSWGEIPLSFELNRKSAKVDVAQAWNINTHPIFIPAKDILGHSQKFIEAYDNNWLDFDITYRDLLIHAIPDVTRGPIPKEQKNLITTLEKQIKGSVLKSKTGRFYLKDRSGSIEFPLVAEGWRKLGLLWTLIRNGSLGENSILFWDEPEANLNPSMFPTVAKILVTLAQIGVQVHIATHSYALTREIEFSTQEQALEINLFALERTGKQGVLAHPAKRFVALKPNCILEEYERLYTQSLQRSPLNGKY